MVWVLYMCLSNVLSFFANLYRHRSHRVSSRFGSCVSFIYCYTRKVKSHRFPSVFNACNDPLDPNVVERIRKHYEEDVLKCADTKKSNWVLKTSERIRLRQQWERKRQRRKDEERLRLNMLWTDLAPHTCTSYDTREYTA